MSHHRSTKRAVHCAVAAAVVSVFATNVSAWVNPLENRYLSGGALAVCDQGSFFVGGVPKVTNYTAGPTPTAPQQLTIGQMYVQFEIPKKRRQWPLIIM